jgi:tetratricopeptide (TPR) repeat protein
MPQVTLQQAFNLGLRHHRAAQLKEAEQIYRHIVTQHPNHAESIHYLGILAHQAGNPALAVNLIRRSIALKPDYAHAHGNLGKALKTSGQIDDALTAMRRSVALAPNEAELLAELVTSLAETGQLDEAIAAFRRSVVFAANRAQAWSHLIHAMHFHPAYDARAIASELRDWNTQHARPLKTTTAHENDLAPNRRLRIGYVSPDFRAHDRRQFEIYCYTDTTASDPITDQLRALPDRWIDIHISPHVAPQVGVRHLVIRAPRPFKRSSYSAMCLD